MTIKCVLTLNCTRRVILAAWSEKRRQFATFAEYNAPCDIGYHRAADVTILSRLWGVNLNNTDLTAILWTDSLPLHGATMER